MLTEVQWLHTCCGLHARSPCSSLFGAQEPPTSPVRQTLPRSPTLPSLNSPTFFFIYLSPVCRALPSACACAGSYSTDRLRQLFGEEFLVEDVILKDSKDSSKKKHKKSKASALVVLDSVQAAAQAAHQVLGDLKNPLLITPYLKVVPEVQQQQQAPAAGSAAAGTAAAGGTGADGSRRPAAPLFAVGGAAGGGSGGRAVQRPSKPLFPSEWCRVCRTQAVVLGVTPGLQAATMVEAVGCRSSCCWCLTCLSPGRYPLDLYFTQCVYPNM